MAEEEAAAEGEGKGKKKKPLLLIIIIAVVLLGGGGGAAFFLMGGEKDAGEHEEDYEEVVSFELFELDTFIVNLANSGNFLKATIQVEYDPSIMDLALHGGEGGGGGHGGGAGGGGGGGGGGSGIPHHVSQRMPIIRDAVINVLSSKSGEEVLSVSGRETLKEELVEAINEAIGLDDPPVVAVYFTEFVVQ